MSKPLFLFEIDKLVEENRIEELKKLLNKSHYKKCPFCSQVCELMSNENLLCLKLKFDKLT